MKLRVTAALLLLGVALLFSTTSCAYLRPPASNSVFVQNSDNEIIKPDEPSTLGDILSLVAMPLFPVESQSCGGDENSRLTAVGNHTR